MRKNIPLSCTSNFGKTTTFTLREEKSADSLFNGVTSGRLRRRICRFASFEFTSPHDKAGDEDDKNQHDGSSPSTHGGYSNRRVLAVSGSVADRVGRGSLAIVREVLTRIDVTCRGTALGAISRTEFEYP